MRKETDAFKPLSLALLLIFYVGIALMDGPQWCVDTPSYVSMDFGREPVYPLFLTLLRWIFNAFPGGVLRDLELYDLPGYLTGAAILQSILWAYAAFYLGCFVYDAARMAFSREKTRLLSACAMLLQVAVAVLNRFVAKRGSMYSESIMTESLAMPLFVIFMVMLSRAFIRYDEEKVIKLLLLSVLMASIRKQMLIVLITWAGASFILHLFVKKYRSLKNFSYTVIAVVLAFVLINLLDASYNLAVRGVFAKHIGDSRGGLDTVLYTASEEDAELFEDADPKDYPDLSLLYTRIYNECKSRELTFDYAPEDYLEMADHYAQSYDVIGFDIVLVMCDEYVEEYFPELDRVHAQIKENQVEGMLFMVLLAQRIRDVMAGGAKGTVKVFLTNIFKAFVISNANISPRILVKISAVIYILFLAGFLFRLVQRALLRNGEGGGAYTETALLFSFVVFAGLCVNCVVTGALIFPQPRYMCYSFGLFYQALVMCYTTSKYVKNYSSKGH